MPELSPRMQQELDLQRKLSRLSAKHRRELRDLLGTPPDPARVPVEFWERVKRERESALIVALLLTITDSQRLHVGRILPDVFIDSALEGMEPIGREWAANTASAAARSNVTTAQNRLIVRSDLWRRFPGPVPAEQFEADLASVFGPRMDLVTAATETTRAQTAGAQGAIGAAQAFGIPTTTRWITAADDRVCPICGPLHKKVVDLWEHVLRRTGAAGVPAAIAEIVANGGPPAHANCRCTLLTVAEAPARRVRTGGMRESVDLQERHKPGWKKVGGSSVHVNADGRIDKGCPGLKGEYVDDLIDEPQHSRDRRDARQAKAEAQGITGRDVNMQQAKRLEGDRKERKAFEEVKAAAKRHGVTPDEIIARIPDVIEARADSDAIRIQAKRAAHKMLGLSPSDFARMENRYKDASNVAGFDEVLGELQNNHPEYGIETEADLWDLLRADHKPRAEVHHADVIDEAAAMAAEQRKRRPSKKSAAAELPAEEPNPWAEIF